MPTIQGDLRVHIRWLIRRDYVAVQEIENASFEYPWDEADFLRELKKRNVIGMVAEYQEHILGYMVYELHPTNIEISNFAVAPSARRRGVGSRMVAKLMGKLSDRRQRLTLVCRESNLAGHLFWKATGFQAKRVIRGAFADTDEDGYLFVARVKEVL